MTENITGSWRNGLKQGSEMVPFGFAACSGAPLDTGLEGSGTEEGTAVRAARASSWAGREATRGGGR